MQNQSKKQWRGVTGGHSIGQKALIVVFHLFNVTVGYVIMASVIPFYMLFAAKGRNSIYRYFRERHGYSPFKSILKTYSNHYVFGQCMLDRFAVYAGRSDFFSVTIEGNEHFTSLLDQESGMVVVSSHVGNFELGGYLLRQQKKHINAVIFGGEAQEVMKNRVKMLEKNNISVVPVLQDMSHIFLINNALSKGEIVSMPCDRSFGSSKGAECDFLGAKAEFPIGAFALAASKDVPVISIFAIKKSWHEYILYVKPVIANECDEDASIKVKAVSLTKAFVKELEEILKIYPEQWFNFYNFWK